MATRQATELCRSCKIKPVVEGFDVVNQRLKLNNNLCLDCRKREYSRLYQRLKPAEDRRVERRLYRRTPNGILMVLRYRCKLRKLAFKLNAAWIAERWNRPCTYCGEKLAFFGIDRIDSSKGYTPANCTVCCTLCNRLKSNLSLAIFFERCDKVAKHCRRMHRWLNAHL